MSIVGAVGIDFGSSRSVIAVAKKKGVDVIANQASNRETPNIVSFGEKERYIGEQGLARAKSNFKNTCAFSNRLLGLDNNYENIKEETKWITSKLSSNEEGQLFYDVTARGEKKQFTPTQVVASMIGELRRIVAHNDIDNKEAVLSVPSYFTEKERKALLDAAKIADLKVSRIISESSAVTLSYGLFRKADLPEKQKDARNVLFVDFGHSKLSTYVSSFTKEKCQVLLQEHDRHLGARDFDWAMLEFYDEIFQKSSGGLSIKDNKKSILRCIDAIQKQRKILSANSHAAISAECLVEDEDLNYDMSREEFEKLIQPQIDRIRVHLQNLKQSIDLKGINIHHIEIVGGASRTPIVQQLITEVYKQEIFRTLNQSECIARGCAMIAAYLSPQFRVAEYQLEECNTYPIKISWNFLNNGEMQEEGKTATFFDRGCTIPNIKSLTFQRSDGIALNLFYQPAPPGFKPEIASIKIPAVQPKEQDYQVKIRVKLNLNGIVELTETSLIEKYKVEEKVLKKKEEPKEGEKKEGDAKKEGEAKEGEKKEEEEYEIKVKEKTRTTEIKSEAVYLYSFGQNDIDSLFNIEAEMNTNDRIILETNMKKNELETLIYEWNDRLTGKYAQYETPAEIDQIRALLTSAQQWLENEGENSGKTQYVERTDAIKKLTDPITNRLRQYEGLPQAFTDIDKVIFSAEEFVNSSDAKFAHITAEERKPIADECAKIRQQLSDAQAKIQNGQLSQDPPITIEQIFQLGNSLMGLAKPIMGKPVPKPKEEEQKPAEGEQKPAEGEQKQEQQNNENKMEEEEPSK